MLTKPPRLAGAASFKQGMRALVGAVTVVAVQDVDGAAAGLTATAVCSLSADPPSLLVCVNRSATIAPGLKKGDEFSVNVLAEDQVDVAQAFGGQKAVRGAGRFAYGSWVRSAHDVPLLVDARANFECVVEAVMDYATHHVVIGHVSDVHLRHPAVGALLYGDGRYLKTDETELR
ncbi:flavin reductase family protein [Terrarubrum flagellatum]|uniref:flavin reductase family protein n=1 Tax=Terrirubrum flagellatum TaxID=2895980 RepID=UPI003144D6E9